MVNAIQEAISMYGSEGFAKLHGAYLQHGYCYSEPGVLALARPCDRGRPDVWVPPADANAWWIELAIGRGAMQQLLAKVPFYLPFIGWRRGFKGDRGERPRFYDTSRFYHLIHGQHQG